MLAPHVGLTGMGAAVLGEWQDAEGFRGKGWEYRSPARGPSKLHKGVPSKCPHPPPFVPHQSPLRGFPAHTPTHMLTHRGARKQVKRFTELILCTSMCTHSNRTERGTKDCEWGLGSSKKKTTHPIQTTSRVKQ